MDACTWPEEVHARIVSFNHTVGPKCRSSFSGVAIGGSGAAAPMVGFCYDQLEIYKSVTFRNWPILDNKELLSLMCICCFITISEVNLL